MAYPAFVCTGWKHGVGSAKSSEIIFSKTLSDITLKADECVFIDNNHKNLTIPESMGMNTIYFDDIKRDMTALENSLIELGIKMQKSFWHKCCMTGVNYIKKLITILGANGVGKSTTSEALNQIINK